MRTLTRKRLHLIHHVEDGQVRTWCDRVEPTGRPHPADGLGRVALMRLCPDCEAAWMFATDQAG